MIEEIDKVLGEDWQTGGAEWGGITGTLANQTDLQSALDGKEPAFSKNTAFNKDFGVGAGQVAEGNALAAKITGPGSSQINQVFVAIDANGNAKMAPTLIDPATGNVQLVAGNLYIDDSKVIVWSSTGKVGGITRGTFGINSSGNAFLSTNLFLTTIKSGATQVGAGAAANEIWKTSSHATLPDNVLIIGV
jgi:hypothetical protein